MSSQIELTVGGRARGFALRLPRTEAGDGIPLVIVLHGNHPDATGQMMRDWTTFDEQADAFGFAVAYPDGIGGCWADGRGVTTADEAGVDDVAFLRAIIDTSAGRRCPPPSGSAPTCPTSSARSSASWASPCPGATPPPTFYRGVLPAAMQP